MAEQTGTATDELRFTLLENALDSIKTALEFLAEEDQDRLKLTVMLLGQGVELVLKARLQEEHWSLVFDDPGQASLTKFEKGDFKSVGFDPCLRRLEEICQVKPDRKHCDELRRLRQMRNRIEHFVVQLPVRAVEGTAYSVLSFLLDFVRDHFESPSDGEKYLLAKIREGVASLEALVDHRWADVKPRIDQVRADGRAILECLACSQEAAVVTGDDRVVCEFCHEVIDPVAMAQGLVGAAYASMSPKDQLSCDFGPWDCPDCDNSTLVAEQPGYLCLSCGSGWSSLPSCDSCGLPFGGNDEDVICGHCFNARMET